MSDCSLMADSSHLMEGSVVLVGVKASVTLRQLSILFDRLQRHLVD